MYEATFCGQTKTYKDIKEDDAYFITAQVLKEMRDEVYENSEYFKTWRFSDMYNALISRVLATADCVYRAHNNKEV